MGQRVVVGLTMVAAQPCLPGEGTTTLSFSGVQIKYLKLHQVHVGMARV